MILLFRFPSSFREAKQKRKTLAKGAGECLSYIYCKALIILFILIPCIFSYITSNEEEKPVLDMIKKSKCLLSYIGREEKKNMIHTP